MRLSDRLAERPSLSSACPCEVVMGRKDVAGRQGGWLRVGGQHRLPCILATFCFVFLGPAKRT